MHDKIWNQVRIDDDLALAKVEMAVEIRLWLQCYAEYHRNMQSGQAGQINASNQRRKKLKKIRLLREQLGMADPL